jgi:16S rRNA (cytosine967-C5)-methyltransferase
VVVGWLRKRRFIGSRDRRAISELVFRVLRCQSALDWWFRRARSAGPDAGTGPAEAGGEEGALPSSRQRIIAFLVLAEEADLARLRALFDGKRYAPAPLDEAEAALAQRLAGQPLDHPDQPAFVRGNYPQWLEPLLHARFGAGLEAEMAALNAAAPFDLRVNALKATREEARAALDVEGIEATPTPLSPWGLRLARRRPLGGYPSFVSGLVEVQDEGSQIVSLLTDARPGMRVVDFCAGTGGKTLALAATMANRGRIAALDASPRIERADPRLARAGVDIATTRRIVPDDPWIGDHAEWADRVLLDVPCTGLGRWRRDPTAPSRLRPGDLEALVARQRRILDQAQALVRPGGRLVYATCSLLGAENEDQVSAFLERHAGFAPVPAPEVWEGAMGGPCPSPEPYLQLTPARHGTDGFFAAILERRA